MKLLTLFLLFISLNISADEKQVTIENTLFNQLIGEWAITDSSLTPDGTWKAGLGADWNFYKILNGNAIQDNWIAPPIGVEVKNGQRQFGTNIRIFNPKESQWEMGWIASNGKELKTFTAIEDNEKIVMKGVFGGGNSQITFFNITENSFDWKLQLEQKDKSWPEVYRIKGTKK